MSLLQAAEFGYVGTVRVLLQEGKFPVDCRDSFLKTPLHLACEKGHLDVARVLVSEFKADVSLKDVTDRTPLHNACEKGHLSIVEVMLSEFKADMNVIDSKGRTPLHYACENGYLSVARFLVFEFEADLTATDAFNCTPLMLAVKNEHSAVVCNLFQDSQFPASSVQKSSWANIQDSRGQAPLHYVSEKGDLDLLLALIRDHGADVNVCNNQKRTALHIAACKFGSDHNIRNRDLFFALVRDHKADGNICDKLGDTPLHIAARATNTEMALALCESGCDPNKQNTRSGQTPLHYACKPTNSNLACALDLVHALVRDHKADVNACDKQSNTPLHIAAQEGRTEVVLALSNSGCDPNMQNAGGQTPLHYACERGDLDLVRALVHNHNADVNLCDILGDTPLHIAALGGKHEVVLTLVQGHGCDPSSEGRYGRTPLHMASLAGHHKTVQNLLKFTSPVVTDEDGNTPLHLASRKGHLVIMGILLDANAPVLIRNNDGQTPQDLAINESQALLQKYAKENRQFIRADYEKLSKHASKKYSGSHNITRVFVLGYPGVGKSSFIESLKREGLIQSIRKVSGSFVPTHTAGKSSFIESLKKEGLIQSVRKVSESFVPPHTAGKLENGLFQSFKKVSESCVPPHTAGIIPSVHMSGQCGRILFYDFAGDAEYYSSHAAIFESLASSRKGDNIFIIVVDLRKDDIALENDLHYWFTFIHYQKFSNASFLVVGSHLDQSAKQSDCLEEFCTSMQPNVCNIKHFMLDCRDPRSNQIALFKKQILTWVSESQKYEISSEARLLLGLLEKDFSAVTACPVQTLVSHIKDSGVWLPVEPNLLYQILLELHEVGILLLLGDCTEDSDLVVLNVSKLTNEVHERLFAESAFVNLKKLRKGLDFTSFNGVFPEKILAKLLPPYITIECLVHLQYCQKISHNDINVFSSLNQEKSASQSFFFFPALCSTDRGQVSWSESSNTFSISWLALCTDPHDYFPPRFLHVLLLRLVYGFTLSSARQKTTDASPEHSRRCTMWKKGVYWKMEEGVDCMVELVNVSRGIVVLTKSAMDRVEGCARVFTNVVSCVMEAKAEFCFSTKPEFFLLDSSSEADYLNEDHQFAVSDVERALESPEGRHVVISVSGKGQLELAKLNWMLNLTLWNSLFPFQLNHVLLTLKVIVREIFDLGLRLDSPYEFLDSLRVNFSSDVDQRRTQLMRWWMKNSPKPPCWYTLVEALEDIDRSTLAEEIREKHGLHIQLQEKLLCEETQALKPNEEFLCSLSVVVGSRWPSLAVSLALTEVEIEELKGKMGLSQQELALRMLKIWVSRNEATYGQLFHKLKTISLLHTPSQD